MNRKESDMIDLTAYKICAYYKQEIKYSEDSDELHPIVSSLRNFMIKYVTSKETDNFFKNVIKNFNFFPKYSELLDLWQEIKLQKKTEIYKQNNFLTFDEDLTQKEAEEKKQEKIKDEEFTWEKIIEDDNNKYPHILKKYGLKHCGELWSAQGEWSFDNDIPIDHLKMIKFDMKQLGQYLLLNPRPNIKNLDFIKKID
jgi:DNA polymerase elongation subunit (family B)